MIFPEPTSFNSPGYYIRAAATPWEASGAAQIRQRVFVEEQRIFEHHDRDEIDLIATHLVALSTVAHEADEVVGTVRIHEEEEGVWWGSRLAVSSSYRHVGKLGSELIRLAVSTANGRGCHTFLAHVQAQNVTLFRRLRWRALREIEIHGHPHALMEADLNHYPPCPDPVAGWYHRSPPLKSRIAA